MSARVHIIDDDDAVRDSLCSLLEPYGYEACGHPSAEAFLVQQGSKPDCIIVDQHMPGMTGLELIEHLRVKGDRTPALMITGRNDATIEPRAARIDVKVLNKPVPEEQLIVWIEGKARKSSD